MEKWMYDIAKWNSDSEFLLDTNNYFTNGIPYILPHARENSNERTRLINERMSEWTDSWPHTRANHWQALHNIRLTSALWLNASNQITVWWAFVIPRGKMWTCRAFNQWLKERILFVKCVRILYSLARSWLFSRACGRPSILHWPAVISRVGSRTD